MSRIRLVILLAAKSVFSLIALAIVMTIVHEGVHYATALILGIPIVSFTWFDPSYFAPVLISGSAEHTLGMTIVSYAGGLVTGVLLLAILVLKRGWFKQSLYYWLLGLYMAMFGAWQLCQGILEGAFQQRYIADATNILSLSYCVGYASAVLGMTLYWVFMPELKALIARKKYS